jgi:quercetin dioxygenase-like cupin family protein
VSRVAGPEFLTPPALIGLALVLGIGCGREPSASTHGESRSSPRETSPGPAVEGFILRTGQGEALQNGIVVKASPATGTEQSILVEQTFPSGGRTALHLHEQGDELFYVVSGRGTATLGDLEEEIGPGDVIFIPRNTVHRIENRTHEEPLRVVFFMASPELVEEFRAIHERVTSDPERPMTPEEREAISERIGGSRVVPERQ